MMPKNEDIDKDVDLNFTKLFEKIKLNKKAEEKVRSVLKDLIIKNYQLHAVKVLVRALDKETK